MKTLSIFDVQAINTILKDAQIDYTLKLQDACGNQSLTLTCTGETTNIDALCTLINSYLKDKHMQVKPGTINPYNIICY